MVGCVLSFRKTNGTNCGSRDGPTDQVTATVQLRLTGHLPHPLAPEP